MRCRLSPASVADLPAILALYNREIREGTALWNTRERTLEEMTAWRADRLAGGFPVIAAHDPAGRLIGYATFGPFRASDGYAATVEHTLYVDPAAQRQGVGRALLSALEAEASARGLHVMVGGLDADNAASLGLHRAAGFAETARLPEVGRKFGRWLTLVMVHKRLTA